MPLLHSALSILDQRTGLFTFDEKFLEGIPGQRASDLESLRHYCWRDELVVGHFFVQLLVGGLVEEHQVVELISNFSLGPLLLRGRGKGRLRMQSVENDTDGTYNRWCSILVLRVCCPACFRCVPTPAHLILMNGLL